MTTCTEIQLKLAFHQAMVAKLQTACLALVDGGVQSYTIDDRSLTRLDLPKLMQELRKEESVVDQLTTLLAGGKRRKAFAILPRDW